MPDEGIHYPLWSHDEGYIGDDSPEELREQLGIPPQLLEELLAWQREWEKGFSDRQAAHSHQTQGRRLVQALTKEAAPYVKFALREMPEEPLA